MYHFPVPIKTISKLQPILPKYMIPLRMIYGGESDQMEVY